MAEIVNTCPLMRPSRLSLARMSTHFNAPGTSYIERIGAAQIESYFFPRRKGYCHCYCHFPFFYA